jgi:hypothetical protein
MRPQSIESYSGAFLLHRAASTRLPAPRIAERGMQSPIIVDIVDKAGKISGHAGGLEWLGGVRAHAHCHHSFCAAVASAYWGLCSGTDFLGMDPCCCTRVEIDEEGFTRPFR